MIVRYREAQSKPYPLPSGGPQGDLFTIILFFVLVSDSALELPPPLPLASIPGDVGCFTGPLPPIETEEEIRLKYFDDLSLGKVVSLKTQLKVSNNTWSPKSYHDRNNLVLISGASKLQGRLDESRFPPGLFPRQTSPTGI